MKGSKKKPDELEVLRVKVADLELTVMETNFSKAVIQRENEELSQRIEKLQRERDSEVEKLKHEIETLKKEKEIETEILIKQKENELNRIKEEFETEHQRSKKETVEFIYKLKSEFFPATPYAEIKVKEEKTKVQKINGDPDSVRSKIEKKNRAISPEFKSKTMKKLSK
jgi:hypothetical protein